MSTGALARGLAAATIGLALAAAVASAATTEVWTREGDTFRVGRLEGMAISPDGQLVPAPAAEVVARPETALLWDIAGDGEAIWAAAGEGAGLLEARPDGSLETTGLDDLPEVLALARGRNGRLYAATGPEGAVYRVRDAKAEELFRPEATYIWDLAVLPGGDLLVATGLPGQVWRVGPAGDDERLLWSTTDPHVRSLAVGDDGAIYAGTAGSGLLVRVGQGQGDGFVLWDSQRSETVAIAVDDEGTVWAAFAGTQGEAESGGTGEPARSQEGEDKANMTVTVRVRADQDDAKGEAAAKATKRKPSSGLPSGGGAVVRLGEDEQPHMVWSDKSETPLDLLARSGGQVLMGTASPARIWWFDDDGGEGWWSELPESKAVSALAAAPDGRLLVATSHPAALVAFGDEASAEAWWVSDVLDTDTRSRFGAIHAVTTAPVAPRLRVEARAGNTSKPGPGWTDWLEVPGAAGPPDATGASVDLPRARFLQVRVGPEEGADFAVQRVEVRYRRANRAPELRKVEVLPAGVALRPVPPPVVTSGDEPVVAPAQGAEAEQASGGGGRKTQWRSKKAYEPGALSVTWESRDLDDDELRYRLELCEDTGTACEQWTVLADDLEREFHSFDSRFLPDGVYRFRVTASDAAQNPIGEGRTATELSAPVAIDNRPPVIERAQAQRLAGGELRLTVAARDEGGRLAGAEVSSDGATWRALPAADGVTDDARERWVAVVESPPAGQGLRVRVVDAGGNVTTTRVDGSSGPRAKTRSR
jgi:hypothetical protein